ncbi:hypothetical protein HYFRA_00000691 [Hymenoscyphus fraxineus]|uniref:Uncharacterized protein n=1 Tax=Hymenoscyphus fraxineus TaxID=746836 RepID=A0A9N9L2L4_9HELO|nr:hypothetical protein HYFRA_00000691 [Hymenoscyphus fraxineus]
MAVLSTLLQFSIALLASTIVSAIPVEPRGVIGHDDVAGFPQTIPGGTTGAVYRAYQPFLKVNNGCVPFPAVNSKGDTSGGLKPSGLSNGGCSKSTGQVYVRQGGANGRTALMYSWYFPKDSPSTELGHRHDWESVVVWLSSSTATNKENILAVCPSAHGGFTCAKSGYNLSGTSPLIKYESVWPVNHALGLSTVRGGQQPLVAWDSLPAAARTSLNNANFGDANVPFKDSNFNSNLGKANF